MGSKRGSNTKDRTTSENIDVNVNRLMKGFPSGSLPMNTGMPCTARRPSATQRACTASTAAVSASTSAGRATPANTRKPCSSKKARCSAVISEPSTKRVDNGSGDTPASLGLSP
jgi:hypothetical protein